MFTRNIKYFSMVFHYGTGSINVTEKRDGTFFTAVRILHIFVVFFLPSTIIIYILNIRDWWGRYTWFYEYWRWMTKRGWNIWLQFNVHFLVQRLKVISINCLCKWKMKNHLFIWLFDGHYDKGDNCLIKINWWLLRSLSESM